MLIKLNLEGELLENLLKDAKRNCRTNPMQIIYYLQEIYAGNIMVLVSTNKTDESTLKGKSSTKTGKHSTQKDMEQLQKQVDDLGDDIIDW